VRIFKIVFEVVLVFILLWAINLTLVLRERLKPSGPRDSVGYTPELTTVEYTTTLQEKISQPPKITLTYSTGEKIVYDIKYGDFHIGKSEFNSNGRYELNGKGLNLLTFETKLVNFWDKEKVYCNPETMLPVKVERDIINLFARERIVEEYDQANFIVQITKQKGKRQEKISIKNTAPINNPILLPHSIRNLVNFSVGEVFNVNLPNRFFKMHILDVEDISVPAGTFKAYHLESEPKQIQIWISADELRIPIKIEGTGIFGYTLLMKKYNPPTFITVQE